MSPTYTPVWVGYPAGPWVIRDALKYRAWTPPGKKHFWHGSFDQACAICDRLNVGRDH